MKTLIPCVLVLLLQTAHASSPASAPVALENFHLVATLTDNHAEFALTATAIVTERHGGSLELLSGPVALTDLGPHRKWSLRADENRFVLQFERAGKFPIQLKFAAAVRQTNGWQSLDFHIAPGALHRLALRDLPADTQFSFPGAARPERVGADFSTVLPTDGEVDLAWKKSAPETEGKLFFSSEMLEQLSLSPGLLRQVALLDFKVMQGEMKQLALRVHGAGEVTRVQGDSLLAWNLEPITGSTDRRLVVQFNQPQRDHFALQIQMQTPLGAFPQAADAPQLRPEGATRFAGYLRVVNEGAVRLEVACATGLSQISPDQFPETDLTRALLKPTGAQRFAYRFSSADFALRIQADQILPEVGVSEVLAYNLGENELAIEGELELDIREAPLRELLLRLPKGYSLARLTAAGMSDYFVHDTDTATELRVLFGQPISGRQLLQFRLERNKPLLESTWALPAIEVVTAKSTRGHIAVAADAGFRLTPERTQGLTEIATAFFPRKVPGIQNAYRISEPQWQASMRVERLPQTVQADVLHLFSIGEGIAYGSSIINYTISGAPLSTLQVQLSDEYFNVEFTGKDLRNWQKTDKGYLVQLHTPVSGTYTLLATYERPFKAQGETLTFTGARPLQAQSEQGHTIIISSYQFDVKPVQVSAGLLPLETGEVPPEYRLFFDAPILAAYRYAARPFDLKLALSPLAQGDSLSQVVDRASLTTHVSKEGQVLTDARYFVKNRGNANLRLTLPPGVQLWSASINGAAVVPVLDANSDLIPLPGGGDPNAVLTLDLKLASRANQPGRLHIATPIIGAPVLLAEWKIEPDTGQRLVYRRGSLTPSGGLADISGFAQFARSFSGDSSSAAWGSLLLGLLLLGTTLLVWRWAMQPGSYRFGPRHSVGLLLGVLCLIAAGLAFSNLAQVLNEHRTVAATNLAFVAPVQQAGTGLSVEVSNLPNRIAALGWFVYGWPALLAVGLWIFAWRSQFSAAKSVCRICGWNVLAWAALRCPNGAIVFVCIIGAFVVLRVLLPALVQLWHVPSRPTAHAPGPTPGAASAATALFVAAALAGLTRHADAAEPATGASSIVVSRAQQMPPRMPIANPDSVLQQIRIEDRYAIATARIHWCAEKGQVLPLLGDPAVLTGLTYPSNVLQLTATADEPSTQQLVALRNGTFDLELRYELQLTNRADETGFSLPSPFGLINQVELTLENLDVDVLSPQAVSIQRDLISSNTVAHLNLAPAAGAWLGWKPRTRDPEHEKAVFFAELSQLYVPAAGVIEALHSVSIRPAQGALTELILDVPRGSTITDVLDLGKDLQKATTGSIISVWRFDPDTRKLRVTLNPPQARPFVLLVRSQFPTGPLPFQQGLGLLTIENAAGQIGLLGLATGNEVQLDNVSAENFSPINLEDFPASLLAPLQAQIPGLTLRRAFSGAAGTTTAADGSAATTPAPLLFTIKASAVEPDIRVEAQNTLSLGEDRTVLASEITADITRAGIFRLSFLMPHGFDVESLSGAALSHWTEAPSNGERVITLHLLGKTEGRQQFSLSLAGPGVRATNSWAAPQLVVREAGKQRGTLLLVPEQGLRLQVLTADGFTQLDPEKSGIKQKGVLAFRVLQAPGNLVLNLERVDPWIQVTSLQHATVTEAQLNVSANLQYQIENAGVKTLRVFLPTNAESVRFEGDQVTDFLVIPDVRTNGLQEWEIRLNRRALGSYLLQATYQVPMAQTNDQLLLRGVQAADINLQRGFVTIQSGARLQLSADSTPTALQPAEWQSIPRILQQGLSATAADFTFRLVEPGFALPLKLQRHEAAKLLAARVNDITFHSVICDDGSMLTQVTLRLLPGDKRLLSLILPPNAHFWFAFVNDNGVWPWREQDRILIPLEQQSRRDQIVPVELFYTCKAGTATGRALDLSLNAPKFDLPLENITWRVSLDSRWHVAHWSGSLQLEERRDIPYAGQADLQTYLQSEVAQQRERTKQAEDFLAAGNSALEQGDSFQARRAFHAAYGLSAHDAAFNEDARVQLHNIKLQQALIGLNVRQAATTPEGALTGKLRDLRNRKELNYTQQDAKDILDRNSADDNAAFMRLAERLIQQQDAAVAAPAALRASIPDQGRLLTFKRSVLVDPWAELALHLQTTAPSSTSLLLRGFVLAATLVLLGLLAWATRRSSSAHLPVP
ncbi:MAG TPA: hypothetical protein VG167_10360 [Verrucomicrobiae bacterium]|nr:hypothetical protein [Verrucomicrobiae bacterium]